MPPVVLGNLGVSASYQARLSYIALSNLSTPSLPRPRRSSFSTSTKAAYSSFDRNDFQGPFTGVYEAPGPTRGPLGQASSHGAPRITPRRLKEYLDRYVIGQERAKKMLSVAVYSHYQRVQELQRQEDEEHERLSREAMMRGIREDQEARDIGENQDNSFISGQRVIKFAPDRDDEPSPKTRKYTPIREDPPPRDPLADLSPITIEKSNVMVLGPTGVGKTHIVRTLARALEVPFSMSDCTPFTQAGYIGEDAELCVQRLLAAADYDVARAEYGIICLDEVDKLAVSRSTNGRDVGGEGVQQALLKIIEGTTLTITAKNDQKSSRTNTSNTAPFGSGFNTNNPSQPQNSGQKPETYTIRTDNILFIFTGAFVGLQKMIMDRLSKGSMGFGASVRNTSNTPHQMTMSNVDAHIYFKNLPFYSDIPAPSATAPPPTKALGEEESTYNPLDLATPQDLQTFGLIPEFLGRIPVTTALAPLSIPSLMRVLTEPRNSIISQYTAMFATFGTELRFTTAALHELAKTAFQLGTGARGVRTAVEMLLGEAMYEVPGSSVRYVLVDGRAARREARVGYWSRGRGGEFRRVWDAEEKVWAEEMERKRGGRRREGETDGNFEEFRERAGSGM